METEPLLERAQLHWSQQPATAADLPRDSCSDGDEQESPVPSLTVTPAEPAEDGKLGTYDGVFVPTTLNVLSILMFLRFGFIIGQAGFLGSLLLLLLSYAINLLTTLSVSAIATNGTVRGGGTYYMISRSLGPEFGGSIGIIFYVGQVLNAGLNIAGFADPLLAKFGRDSGELWPILPEGYWYSFSYQTMLLLVCTVVCLVGPALFARSSKMLFWILIAATVSIPISAVFRPQFLDERFDEWYTGFSWRTLSKNMFPQFTKGAAGSEISGRENFKDLFGIFFPATAGILAGASMSGDLRTPSKSIPSGTLWGLVVTIALYFLVILSISATTSRELLYLNVNIISDISLSPSLVMLGEFATSIFSALMGIIGAAKLLQAVARDRIVPFTGVFAKSTGGDDNPVLAICFTYVLTQLTIFLDVNQIAVYITMAFLMTFIVTNIACFLLDVASAPNFRPSFRYFDSSTALLGSISCIASMVGADGMAASLMLLLGVSIFFMIHLYSSPKPWGDVSQAIIYHQVRKYLLKLRQDHVKYWRPQILLMVDDPRSCYNLMQFCNSLKKGGLFILGHVIISHDFQADFAEISRQRSAWTRLRDICRIKAFVQVSASPDIVWGVRNIYLGSGLGGMRPNITVLGFYDEWQRGQRISSEGIDMESLPTDFCRKESHMNVQQWVQVLEDLLTMGTNVAVAKGFMSLEMPQKVPLLSMLKPSPERLESGRRNYIDLYPIQMSAKLVDREGRTSGLSINFDTYTLILQLGAILHTVEAWNFEHDLRLIAFVEQLTEVERERARILKLLDTLRIPAEVIVVSLDEGNDVYDVIVKGHPDKSGIVSRHLHSSKWWNRVCKLRKHPSTLDGKKLAELVKGFSDKNNTEYVVPEGGLTSARKKRTVSSLQQLGVAHSMQSTRWSMNDFDTFYDTDSDSGSSLQATPEDPENVEVDEYGDDEMTPSFQYDAVTIQQLGHEDHAAHADTEGSTFPDSSLDVPQYGDLDDSASGISAPYQYQNPCPKPSASAPSPSSPKMDSVDSNKISLRFNDLPAKAQHLILNCLMRRQSKDASVIFTTLPAPALGTHMTEKASRDYHALIETTSESLPPVMFIHSQSMTVTTAL